MLIPVSFAVLLIVPELLHFRVSLGEDRLIVLAMLIALASTWSVLYLSSLVDWFYVLPRLRGQAQEREPCDSMEPTEVNANRLATVPGGPMSLGEAA
jgi:hypothetical protein